MKKLIAFAAIAALLASCSGDDSTPVENEEFFPLAEGNLWVYKRYDVSASGLETTSGRIDSVRVIGYYTSGGKTYSDLRHRIYNGSGAPIDQWNELLRIDENGHLVNSGGKVVHPGNDADYQYTRPEVMGTMAYQVEEITDMTVEGQNYTVIPFTGYYTPDPGMNIPAGIGERVSLQPEIGIIIHHCRYLSSPAYFEDRLVYYELN